MSSQAHKDLAEYVSTLPERDQRWNPGIANLVGAAKYGALPFPHWTVRGHADAEALEDEAGIPADSWPMYEDYKPDPPPLPPEAQVGWDEKYEWPRIERAAAKAANLVIREGDVDYVHRREEAAQGICTWVMVPKNKATIRKCLDAKTNAYMDRTFKGRVQMYMREFQREAERKRRSGFYRPWWTDLGVVRAAVVDYFDGTADERTGEVHSALARLKKQKYQQHDVLAAVAGSATRSESGKVTVDYDALADQLGKAARDREKYALRELQKLLEKPVYSNATKVDGDEKDFPSGEATGDRQLMPNRSTAANLAAIHGQVA